MTRWIAVVLVAACGKSKAPEPRAAAPGSSAHAARDAAAAHAPPPQELPAKGVANSAVESVPRKDWPCRYVETLDSVDPRGTHIATTWQYGKRTHCWIPTDLAGSREIVGCPDMQVQQNLENKVSLEETYGYDTSDHLTSVQTAEATFEYAWDGDLVRGYTLRGESYPYLPIDHGVAIKQGDDTVHVVLDPHGHVASYQHEGSLGFLEPTRFTWQGTRLVKLQVRGAIAVEYGCKSPPKG